MSSRHALWHDEYRVGQDVEFRVVDGGAWKPARVERKKASGPLVLRPLGSTRTFAMDTKKHVRPAGKTLAEVFDPLPRANVASINAAMGAFHEANGNKAAGTARERELELAAKIAARLTKLDRVLAVTKRMRSAAAGSGFVQCVDVVSWADQIERILGGAR